MDIIDKLENEIKELKEQINAMHNVLVVTTKITIDNQAEINKQKEWMKRCK